MLRHDGDQSIRSRVETALSDGEACWCSMVRLELWNGARGAREKEALIELGAALPNLPILEEVWELATRFARLAREAGITVPNTDLLIAACASFHSAALEHSDAHFDLLEPVSKRGLIAN